jgi:hypothetical protein
LRLRFASLALAAILVAAAAVSAVDSAWARGIDQDKTLWNWYFSAIDSASAGFILPYMEQENMYRLFGP